MLGSQRELLWRPIRFMPLIKSPSKTARNKKIKTEIAAGKPPNKRWQLVTVQRALGPKQERPELSKRQPVQ